MRIQPNRRDYVTCTECDRPHKLQSKDLAAHLNSLASKGDRKATRQQQPPAPVSDREAVIRLRNMRAAYAHVPAEHMPTEIREVLGV